MERARDQCHTHSCLVGRLGGAIAAPFREGRCSCYSSASDDHRSQINWLASLICGDAQRGMRFVHTSY